MNMANDDLIREFGELSARIRRIERWMEHWRNRDRQMEDLFCQDIACQDVTGELVTASEGYKVNASRGLGANFHVSHDPASQEFPVGVSNLALYVPSAGYHSIIPSWWTIPAKEGNAQPAITVVFDDGTFTVRVNTGASPLTEYVYEVEYANHGRAVTQVKFDVDNQGGAPETQDLGIFKFEGWQF